MDEAADSRLQSELDTLLRRHQQAGTLLNQTPRMIREALAALLGLESVDYLESKQGCDFQNNAPA